MAVKGEQTEALVGEKGNIIRSLHELTRTVIQRKTGAGTRLRLDVADYAVKRKEALIELVKILTHTLKLSDCKYAYALIKSDSLIEHYKDNGYIEGDSYNKEMIKRL